MDSTVQPDKKLMADTVSSPSMSSTGLITTPPPIPQMAPATLARRLTKKKIIINSTPSCFLAAATLDTGFSSLYNG